MYALLYEKPAMFIILAGHLIKTTKKTTANTARGKVVEAGVIKADQIPSGLGHRKILLRLFLLRLEDRGFGVN